MYELIVEYESKDFEVTCKKCGKNECKIVTVDGWNELQELFIECTCGHKEHLFYAS